jgi:hypothetical protein
MQKKETDGIESKNCTKVITSLKNCGRCSSMSDKIDKLEECLDKCLSLTSVALAIEDFSALSHKELYDYFSIMHDILSAVMNCE